MNSERIKKKKLFKSESIYHHDFLLTKEWKTIRDQALKKYGHSCMKCKSKQSINVDHVLSRKTHPELALTLSNLQTLCSNCNKEKGNRTSDYRPTFLAPETDRSKLVTTILRKHQSCQL